MPTDFRAFRLRRKDWNPAGEAIDPVVHVHSRSSAGAGLGSGFVIDGWNRVVVTAAHVLPRPAETTSVLIEARSVDGLRFYRAYARSFAVPRPRRKTADIAVLWLSRPLGRVRGPLQAYEPGPDPFSASVCGYPTSRGYAANDVVAELAAPFIQYSHGASAGGMSGGPLRVGRKVYGVHLGRFRWRGKDRPGALTLDGELLTACMNAAAAEGT